MRMLGQVWPSWCPSCHGSPGMDCPDRGKGTRAAKRLEQRAFRRDTELLAEPSWRERDLERRLSGGDCQHGCNGVCAGELCNFTCHENRCENCTAPARHWLDTGWFCSAECYGEYGAALVRSLRQ